MSTLAASFLQDFDDEDELPQLEQQSTTPSANATPSAASSSTPPSVSALKQREHESDEVKEGEKDGDVATTNVKHEAGGDEMQMSDEEEEGKEAEVDDSTLPQLIEPAAPSFNTSTPMHILTSLLHSHRLQSHLETIRQFQHGSDADATSMSDGSAPPLIRKEVEYPYLVASNQLSFEIDSHIQALHKVARDIYAIRYSELEQLLTNPVEYAYVARLLGNENEMGAVERLLDTLPKTVQLASNIKLTISVTATTTRGKALSEDELKRLCGVCDTIIQLDEVKSKLHAYIKSRMLVMAPNVSALLGTDVAAKLVALAGGIKKLADIPACNIQVLGRRGKNATGLSRVSQNPHDGLIAQAPIMSSVPPSLKQKSLRLLGGKVALAARLDSFTSNDDTAPIDSSAGESLKAEIGSKIEKWQEAPAQKVHKALPIPLQRAKPRRAGRRYRKEKEMRRMSELTKQKNRMAFGKEELTDEYTGEGMGMIGQDGSGMLRIQQKEVKLSQRLSKKMQQRLKRSGGQSRTLGGGTTTMAGTGAGTGTTIAAGGTVTSLAPISGTASSIAFTPLQGMEIKKGMSTAATLNKASYFSSAGFAKVKKEGGSSVHTAPAAAAASDSRRALPPVPAFSADSKPPDAKRQRVV